MQLLRLLPLTAASLLVPASLAAAGPAFAANTTNLPCAPTTHTHDLRGPAINGETPTGTTIQAVTDNHSPYAGCVTVQVSNVNLPDGTVLTVAPDDFPTIVGTITLHGGAGTMPTFNYGKTILAQTPLRVFNGPDDPSAQHKGQILIGATG